MSGRPNVLLVMTDQHRFDAVGCNGNPHVKTPHLDGLAADAVNFQRHTCSSPICTPARASILTGRYPRTHGATVVGTKLDPQTETLATWLSAAGYACGIFGKSHLEAERTNFNWRDGALTGYYGFHEAMLSEDNLIGPYMGWIRREHPAWEAEAWLQANEEVQQPTGYGLDAEGRMRAVRATKLPVELTQSAWITRQAERFIRDNSAQARPFFAVCSYVPPHHPFTPPMEYAARYDPATLPPPRHQQPSYACPLPATHYASMPAMRDEEFQRMKAHYYALITMLDDQVGRLLATLKETSRDADTIVIFTSDHGDYLGDHGLVRKAGVLFDNLLRVPLIVRVPGVPAGRVCAGPTQHEDLVPTVLDLVGLNVPDVAQGRSFAGVLGGGQPSPRTFSFFEYYWTRAVGVSDGRWKLMRYPTCDTWVLVDTQADPMELTNLCGRPEYRESEARLRDALLAWLADTALKRPDWPVAW